MKTPIRIVGAGFAGLSLAWLLAKKGVAVEVYERESRTGGLLGTHLGPDGLAETGANGILVTRALLDLCADVGVEALPSLKASRRRYIWRDEVRRWPLTFLETLILAGRFAPGLLKKREGLRPRAGESLQDWGRRNLGRAGADFLLAPAMQGIYAGDPSKMSASLILGPLLSKQRKKGDPKGLISFRGGMQELVSALEKCCREKGVTFQTRAVTREELAEGDWVLATSAWDAAALLGERAPGLSALLEMAESLPLLTATIFFEESQYRYPGFGCLFPQGAPTKALGVLMNSYIFEGRGKTYNETWIFGGAKDADSLKLTDEALVTEIRASRRRLFGLEESVRSFRITRWPRALPHYTLQWEKVLQAVLSKEQEVPGVLLHGNWLGGIGLSHILDRSLVLAQKIEIEAKQVP